jgi:MFS family permease
VLYDIAKRPLLIFASCLVLFHLANSAMLPLMAGILTRRSGEWATVLIAACIVVPQIVAALAAPRIGRQAQEFGRRPLFLLGFLMLPIRGVLFAFAFTHDATILVVVQMLDGVSAAVLAVMVPLVIADVTRGTGHFNLAQGAVGSAIGIGASFSTTIAGYITDHFSGRTAFLVLASIAAIGLALAWAFMPETKPTEDENGD